MLNYISPSFSHEKLNSPNYGDLIDVFEDRMRKWLLEPAKHLLMMEYGDVPAVSLALGYFEAIEIYYSGKDSKGASKKFFCRGFQRVFNSMPENAHLFEQIVDCLYVQARCGFAHDGIFRSRVLFSNIRPEALIITWPQENGEFVKNGHLESVIINGAKFIDSITKHFDNYLVDLRSEGVQTFKKNFLAAVDLKWSLNEPDRVIGMTESEFYSPV